RKLVGAAGALLLTVTGEQLVYDGCRGGDLLLVEAVAEEELENGDVIVARVGGEPTAKRNHSRGSEAVLETTYADDAPTLVREDGDLTVIRRVLGVVRRLRAPVPASAAPEEDPPAA